MIKLLGLTATSLLFLAACNQPTSNNNETTADTTITQAMIDEHTSEKSLDWSGTYEGTIPCADCPGIKTTVVLNDDHTFQYDTEYLEKNVKSTDNGTFSWENNGSTVRLKGKETNSVFKVGENQLTLLDTEGNVITGDLADHYIFKKK